MPHPPPLARCALTLGLAAALAGCATVSRSAVSGVAVDGARIYLVDAGQVRHLRDDGRRLSPLGALPLPCRDPLDVEVHGGALHLLCADGRVFASRSPTTADAWQPRLPALTSGVATALQRADGQLVQVTRHDPPPRRGISFDGPGPDHGGRVVAAHFSEPVERGLLDLWHGAGEDSPATADPSGRAFLFSTRLFRRTQLLVSAAGLVNLRCRVRGGHWSIDVAVDERRLTFASLSRSPAELVVLRLTDDGTVRARVHDPRTGARLRARLRCVR